MKKPVADDSPADRASSNDDRVSPAAAPRHWVTHATDPHILFPAIALLALAAIWGTTLNLINVERTAAAHAAATSSSELVDTYEAQLVRALREIDQTLKLVKYAFEGSSERAVLQDLKARALLPPELLFVVSIADGAGKVVASTRPSKTANVADQAYFQNPLVKDALLVGRPRQRPGAEGWDLHFSRRLNAVDGSFSGSVTVSVDAAYFVSGYESSKFGAQGVLGVLGTDGISRVRRVGEAVSAGDSVDFAEMLLATDRAESRAMLLVNAWDGVQRYTSARRLYDFPLIAIVGLSADDQLAGSRRKARGYLWIASAASLLLLLIVAVLWRMSRQLALSRVRAVEAHIAHAERVQHLAYHDVLTMLPNRSLFSKLLGQNISQAHRYNRQLAVLFLDLDRFKQINDTLGHEAGDLLLQEVAGRLKACLRESDTVARLGGDEFVVLLPDLTVDRYVVTVARKILSAIARPFVLLGQEVRVTASVGISIYPEDGLDEQTLTKNADIAMYQAKESGKNNFQLFSRKLNDDSLERLTLESGLRQALERNEFRLHYQAKRAIRSGRITGTEALLRWEHPELGTVAPMRFLQVAEETGLIVPIGKWVLRAACLQNVAWRNQGLSRLSMAVNLSARQFSDETLLADLAAILSDTGMEAHLLELEISESLLMRDLGKALRILAGIRDMGIRIAIDDFGIGYSSLSMLKKVPLDTIKIDRSFSRDPPGVAENRELTGAIIAMGRALSLTVVAQGVETKEQAEDLCRAGCDELQGFYLSKPLPADQIAGMLRTQPDAVDASFIPRATP